MKTKKKDSTGLSRRDFLYLSGAGLAGMTLSAPGLSFGAEKKPKYGGRLRVGERYASTGLDAHRNQYFMDFQNYVLMYNALTIMGPLPQVRMYPDIAKSWQVSEEGREFVFALREGVKFHHGKEMDSGDVKYSFDRVMNPKTRAPMAFQFKWVDSVKPIDKYHIQFTLKEPFAPFLTTLTIQSCPIIPAGWEPTGTKPAPGTGPFMLKSFLPNETTELVRFDNYWEIDEKTGMRLPYLDSIFVKKIVDETIRWTGLRAGDLDYIQAPPQNIVVEELKNPTPGIVTVAPQPVGCIWIYFNVSKPPYDNKKVRQAIAYAIDKKELIKAAYWGLGEYTNNQPFLNRSRMYVPVEDREYNPEKAKQLLAEAGYPNGFKAEFLEFSNTTYLDGANVVVGQLKKVGIDATLKVLDRAPYHEKMKKGEYSISLRGDSERLDPDVAYYMRLHSSEIGKNNWSQYSNKKLDDLLEKGRTTWEWSERVPIYQEVVKIIREDLPILYLAKSIIPVAYRDYVKGHEAGAATWFGYYGGGLKYTWMDK
jgi:peptide/nickel transport system substrate-binding protein